MQVTSLRPGSRLPRRVLVIDDEQRMADSLKTLFLEKGFEVETANSGDAGLAKLEEWEAPVVITDLRMSNGDGLEVMKALAERPATAFIVITGHASTESAIEALQRRAFDYVTKPFEFDVLLSAVERAFIQLEIERFRDDMISMISHDVKIPLTSILGYSSMLYDKSTGQPHPRGREFAAIIRSNGQKMLSLLDNFLTSCKIDAGRLNVYFRPINVHSLVEDVVGMFDGETERHKLRVERDLRAEPATIEADESLLSRAVSNMISNACKFTPNEGLVQITTRSLAAAESELKQPSIEIKVSNSGPGISAEDLPHILEKYQRSASTRGVEGSGIGSYVLRYVVEAHAGRVLVESVPNVLTSFALLLPVEQSKQREEAQQP